MTIFDKFQPLAEARQQLQQNASDFLNVVMEEIISGTEAIVNGRRTVLAGSNNYLGLSFNSDCITAACQAAREEGTGTTGSRMANGTFSGHLALEKELAELESRSTELTAQWRSEKEALVIPELRSDVLVVGGGTGGAIAAIVAAREGARTALTTERDQCRQQAASCRDSSRELASTRDECRADLAACIEDRETCMTEGLQEA